MDDLASKRALSLILIEQAQCLLSFYQYKPAKQAIKRALALLNLNVKLTGRLGRRTKFQEFDIAQLVLDVQTREVTVVARQEVPDLQVEEESKG